MNKYIFLLEWSDYEFWKEFEGESIYDPNLLIAVTQWISRQCDDQIADHIVDEGREGDFDIQLKYALVSGDVSDASGVLSIVTNSIIDHNEKYEAERKIQDEKRERELLEHLKKKYEKD